MPAKTNLFIPEMGRLVRTFASVQGIPLWREPLLMPEEVMLTTCPIHGAGPCSDNNGQVYRYGCLFRQIEACRAERLAPEVACSRGSFGDTPCI